MTVIEIPDDQAAALKARAAAHGLTLEAWFAKLAEEEAPASAPLKPFKTGRGMLAKYGPAPSAEEIDQNRRDMFRGFAQDFRRSPASRTRIRPSGISSTTATAVYFGVPVLSRDGSIRGSNVQTVW